MKAQETRIDFSQVYTEYYKKIFYIFYAKTNNYELSEDLTQEVFLTYFLKMKNIAATLAWLRAASRNVLCNYYKEKRRHPALFIEDRENIEEKLPGQPVQYETSIVLQKLVASIEDEKDREIFQLVAVEGRSFKEASDMLNMDKGTVRYRYINVTKRLVDRLREMGIRSIGDLLD